MYCFDFKSGVDALNIYARENAPSISSGPQNEPKSFVASTTDHKLPHQ